MQSVYVILALAGLAGVCQAANSFAELKACIPKMIKDLEAIPLSKTLIDANAEIQEMYNNPDIKDYGGKVYEKYYNKAAKFHQIRQECDKYADQYFAVMNKHTSCRQAKRLQEAKVAKTFPKIVEQEAVFRALSVYRGVYIPVGSYQFSNDVFKHFD